MQKSYNSFTDGIEYFESIFDYPNCALLAANCAKLMRLYSKFYTDEFFNRLKNNDSQNEITAEISSHNHKTTNNKEKNNKIFFKEFSANYYQLDESELFNREKSCLIKAIEYYLKAINYLESNHNNKISQEMKIISNSIYWDLSSTYFHLACLMQDYVPLSILHLKHDEIEKEITEYMNRSISCLKSICSEFNINNETSSKNIDYRIATIHHRLASLYHHSYREQVCFCLLLIFDNTLI